MSVSVALCVYALGFYVYNSPALKCCGVLSISFSFSLLRYNRRIHTYASVKIDDWMCEKKIFYRRESRFKTLRSWQIQQKRTHWTTEQQQQQQHTQRKRENRFILRCKHELILFWALLALGGYVCVYGLCVRKCENANLRTPCTCSTNRIQNVDVCRAVRSVCYIILSDRNVVLICLVLLLSSSSSFLPRSLSHQSHLNGNIKRNTHTNPSDTTTYGALFCWQCIWYV